jgi:hypothetical protein
MTQFLNDRSNLEHYFTTLRFRLLENYSRTALFLKAHKIPFDPANSGTFIWINLSRWLSFFENDEESAFMGLEMRLTLWLMKKGVYLEPGAVSDWLYVQHNFLIQYF